MSRADEMRSASQHRDLVMRAEALAVRMLAKGASAPRLALFWREAARHILYLSRGAVPRTPGSQRSGGTESPNDTDSPPSGE